MHNVYVLLTMAMFARFAEVQEDEILEFINKNNPQKQKVLDNMECFSVWKG